MAQAEVRQDESIRQEMAQKNIDTILPFLPEKKRMRELASLERGAVKRWLKVYGKKRGRSPEKETAAQLFSLRWEREILGLGKVTLGTVSGRVACFSQWPSCRRVKVHQP